MEVVFPRLSTGIPILAACLITQIYTPKNSLSKGICASVLPIHIVSQCFRNQLLVANPYLYTGKRSLCRIRNKRELR